MKLFFGKMLLAAVVGLMLAGPASAGLIVADYGFVGGSAASTDGDATTTAGDFMLGAFTGGTTSPGISSGTETAFARTNSTGATTAGGDSLAEAIANDAYFSFTLNTDANAVDMEDLTFDHSFTAAFTTGVFSVAVMVDQVGFTDGDELATFAFSGVSGDQAPETRVVDLTSVTELQSFNGTAEFRFYLFDNSNANQRIHRLADVVLEVVPEPASLALLSLGGLVLLRRRG